MTPAATIIASCWMAAAASAVPPGAAPDLNELIAQARDGDVIEVPAGVYRQRVAIDRRVSIVGRGRPIIDGGGGGDVVEITAPGVTFRGFTVRNTGADLDRENAAIRVLAPQATIEDNVLDNVLFGIDLRQAPGSVIRNNRIGGKDLDIARRGDGLRLWRSNDTTIEGNVIHDGRDAILWYSSNVVVRGNESVNCRYGLHLMYSDNVRIEDNRLSANSVGIYIMYSAGIELNHNELIRNRGPSGYGIGLKEADQYTIASNLITGNRVGMYLDGSPFTRKMPGRITGNAIAYNDIGMTFLPSARGNEVTGNNFIDNVDHVSVAGRGTLEANAFWKGDRGNFWSDYTGYDEDGDGIGDFVHESQTLFENMLDREPKLRLFLFSPVQQAVELVGRALPAVRPEPKFVDEVPLMAPVALDGQPHGGAGSAALGWSGMGLCTLGLVVVALTRAGWRP